MTVIRPYLEDVVIGKDRDWGNLLRGAVKDMIELRQRRQTRLPYSGGGKENGICRQSEMVRRGDEQRRFVLAVAKS